VFGNGGRPNATAGSDVNAEDGNKKWIAPARAASRDDQSALDTTDDNFLQEVGINLGSPGAETHGGGDVMLFAGGAGSKKFKGTVENIKVFDKVKEAAGL
jgi:alkaline phosphatase